MVILTDLNAALNNSWKLTRAIHKSWSDGSHLLKIGRHWLVVKEMLLVRLDGAMLYLSLELSTNFGIKIKTLQHQNRYVIAVCKSLHLLKWKVTDIDDYMHNGYCSHR